MLKTILDDFDSITSLAVDLNGGLVMTVIAIGLGLVLWRARKRQMAADDAKFWGRIAKTSASRFHEELPESIHLLAAFGSEASGPNLRTTWGLRVVCAAVVAGLLWLLWEPTAGEFVPKGLPTLGFTLFANVCIAEIWLFRAEVDQTGLRVRRFVVWRRSWDWADLVDVKHDGGYEMVLNFGAAGKARVWKHLAGIDRLLTLAEEALDRNKAATCPNSPRLKPSAAGLFQSWKGGASSAR
jgi:hypothetical protein